MLKMNGTDDFADRFDFFKWSAPVYETPEEAITALWGIDFKKNPIRTIRCIGSANITGLEPSELYQAIQNAGIEPGNEWWKNYPHLSNIPIARKIELYEPVQIVYSDGSTFEFLPMEDGRVRFAQNSIPQRITDGINKSNIRSDAFMGEQIRGETICSCDTEAVQTTVFCKWRGKLCTRSSVKYRYIFSLRWPLRIVAEKGDGAGFTVTLDNQQGCGKITCREARECRIVTNQIPIIPGRDFGGTIWILPSHSDNGRYENEHADILCDSCGMSIDEIDAADFLQVFLYRYFDPDLQTLDQELSGKEFDWHGINMYSRESIKRMVSDIRDTAVLLETDFDNPALTDIKSCFGITAFSRDGIEPPKVPINEHYRQNAGIAADFYNRFADRLETMLTEQPDCDVISFAGP